jgi:hypothetical protein
MKDPAFLFYSSDFLTGCTNLTMEERGQYISLLCIQHQTGHLSEKTIRLSVGIVSDDILSKFKKDENGLFYNERLEIEIEKRANFVGTRRTNGSLGGRPKKENTEEEKPVGLPLAKPIAKPTKKLIENEDVNEIITVIDNIFDSKYLSEKTKSTLTLLLSSYKKEQIINAIKWAKGDNFWNAQFLSPAKLNTKNKDGVLYIDVFLAGYEKNKPVEYVKKEFVSNNPYFALCDSQPSLSDRLKKQQYEPEY